MTPGFKGKIVMVTGGNSGIGKAACLRFADEGAAVAVVARNEPAGRQVVEAIQAKGGAASLHLADVAVKQEIDSAIDDIIRCYGTLDMAFNNAGTAGGAAGFEDVTQDAFADVFAVNLFGVINCMQKQIRIFLEQGKPGAIVNCASISGLVGVPYQSAYCASKHAVIGLTKSVALEHARHGIRINAVCPGGVATPLLKSYLRALPKERAAAMAPPPLGRAADPDEIVGLVTWLCSDEASFVIGQAYAIDGGYTTG